MCKVSSRRPCCCLSAFLSPFPCLFCCSFAYTHYHANFITFSSYNNSIKNRIRRYILFFLPSTRCFSLCMLAMRVIMRVSLVASSCVVYDRTVVNMLSFLISISRCSSPRCFLFLRWLMFFGGTLWLSESNVSDPWHMQLFADLFPARTRAPPYYSFLPHFMNW